MRSCVRLTATIKKTIMDGIKEWEIGDAVPVRQPVRGPRHRPCALAHSVALYFVALPKALTGPAFRYGKTPFLFMPRGSDQGRTMRGVERARDNIFK